jgi:hypothetical protein
LKYRVWSGKLLVKHRVWFGKQQHSKNRFRAGRIIVKLGQLRRLLYAQGKCSFMFKVNRKKAHQNADSGLKK